MSDKRNPGPREQAGGRAERLAAALRANLRRRKLQARGRAEAGGRPDGDRARGERGKPGE